MRNRLALAFFGVICLTLGLVYLFIQNSSASVLQNSFQTAFQKEIQPLLPKLTNYYESNNQSWEGVDSLPIFTGETTNPLEANNITYPQDLILIDESGKIVAPKSTPLFGTNLSTTSLKATLPINFQGSAIGRLGSILMLADLPGLVSTEFNALFSRSMLVALVASGIIAMYNAVLATNTVVRPITDMTSTVEKMAGGNVQLRVNPKTYGYANLITLAESINFLTDSLGKAESQQREMIADIAHELRTPLAVQKSYLEAIEDDIIPLSKDSLVTLQTQNLLLIRLVNDLRLLAAAEAGELHLVLRQMDLTLSLVNVLEQFYAKIEEVGLTINLIAPEPHPIILGDPNRIEQIINNLMQNETRYAPPETELEIACHIRDHKAVLTVRDYGHGVPEEQREAIFKRFYRIDKGIRAEAESSGLGLPIARKLAEAHGGTLVAGVPIGKGVVFTLTLPLAYEPIKLHSRRS